MKDRLMEQSDPHTAYICTAKDCGFMADAPYMSTGDPRDERTRILRKEGPFCRRCGSGEHVKEVQLSYGYKLFDQEVQAFSIGMRYTVESGDAPVPTRS